MLSTNIAQTKLLVNCQNLKLIMTFSFNINKGYLLTRRKCRISYTNSLRTRLILCK